MNTFGIIMAGGGGTRFWPLSRKLMPKQLLNLTGNDIMINETVERNLPVIPAENLYIVTSGSQADVLRERLNKNIRTENILMEPIGRNTSACIGYAAEVINRRYGDGILCIFPSDAYIKDTDEYRRILSKACECAQNSESIVTIGIKPSYPSTGYGYIKYSGKEYSEGVFYADGFVEKPDSQTAESYLKEGGYLWNCGIFVVRTSVMLKNIERFLPKLYGQLEIIGKAVDTPQQRKVLEQVYPRLQSISIDYGVIERSSGLMVIPAEIGWSDIGSFDALSAVAAADKNGNIVKADFTGIDTHDSIFVSDQLVAAIGVENLIVVSTPDAILVCSKDRAQDVKDIVELLKGRGKSEYL